MTHDCRTCAPGQARLILCLRRGGGTGTACSPFGGSGGRTCMLTGGGGSSTSCCIGVDQSVFGSHVCNFVMLPFESGFSASDADGTCHRSWCTEFGFCTARSGTSAAESRTVRISGAAWNLRVAAGSNIDEYIEHTHTVRVGLQCVRTGRWQFQWLRI